MRLSGSESWQIHVERGGQSFDIALWVRAAERIDAIGPLIPGPLEISPEPQPSVVADEEMAQGWAAWWEGLVRTPKPDLPHRPDMSYRAPDFDGLAQWPALREVAMRRWREADDWRTNRAERGIAAITRPGTAISTTVQDVERALGRRVKPFILELIVLPVRDDQVRQVHETRYLVPERVYDGDSWPGILRPIVTALGA